jgi:tRNA(Ile)-lysidine synthase
LTAPLNPALAALQSLQAHHDLPQPLAVAYSGGADSSALLRAAAQLWPGHLQAIHIHHGLQAAADGFAHECQQVCGALAVPLSVVRVNAQPRTGQSPEDAARTARYQALARAAQESQCQAVLLGQHADDQAETLLLALGRGAGLPGLAAMPERFERHGMVFMRPLLALGAQELRQWLLAGGHSFVDDPSNGDERFARNKLRARLLPALAEVMPHFRQTLARSARHAAQAQALLEEVAAADLLEVGSPPAIQALQALSPARQANVLRHWLATCHSARASTAQLDQLQHQIAACQTRGHRIELRVAHGQVRRSGLALSFVPAAPQA